MISDNGKTFEATGKWLKVLKKDAGLLEIQFVSCPVVGRLL